MGPAVAEAKTSILPSGEKVGSSSLVLENVICDCVFRVRSYWKRSRCPSEPSLAAATFLPSGDRYASWKDPESTTSPRLPLRSTQTRSALAAAPPSLKASWDAFENEKEPTPRGSRETFSAIRNGSPESFMLFG